MRLLRVEDITIFVKIYTVNLTICFNKEENNWFDIFSLGKLGLTYLLDTNELISVIIFSLVENRPISVFFLLVIDDVK